jgi:CubicO group peptidase (beta-lactamase class C family)
MSDGSKRAAGGAARIDRGGVPMLNPRVSARQLFSFLMIGIAVLLVVPSRSRAAAYPRTELTDRVDALFEEWDRPDSPGAALGIVKDGRLIYARGYGMANLEYDIPITPQSVFRTGSVGKQFTAMCIAILAEAGKLSLDDDIRKHLPEMPVYERPITIRHLVHHTSGLRDYLVLQGLAGRVGDYYFTTEEGIELLSRQKGLNFLPGEKYLYSNSGYFLLGEIVARVSGSSLREFARKQIFEPLGMDHSHFHDDRYLVVRNRATGYAPTGDGAYRIATTQLEIVGDGSVFTTIEDYFKWDQNFFDNKLGRGTQALLDMVLTRGRLNAGTEIEYAFGLGIDSYRGVRRVAHSGSYMGYRANYTQFPDVRFSVIIHSNLSTFAPGSLAEKIADIYLEENFTEPRQSADSQDWQGRRERRKTIRLPVTDLKRCEGDYYSDELDVTARIRLDGKKLTMALFRTLATLEPLSSDTFLSTYENDDPDEIMSRTLRFTFAQSGKPDGFRMDADPIRDLGFERVGWAER